MTSLKPPPSADQVARVLQRLADEHSLERSRFTKNQTWQRLQRRLHEKQDRDSVWQKIWARVGVAGAAVATAALVLAILSLWPPPEPMDFVLRGGQMEDGWVVANSERPAALEFTDGSVLELEQSSALRVSMLGRHSALSRLSNGKVRVQVKHHDDTNWTFLAGPYEVRVEGTAFELGWMDSTFSIQMREGRVRVMGPDQQQWVLTKNDSLIVPTIAADVAENDDNRAPSTELAQASDEATEVLEPKEKQGARGVPSRARSNPDTAKVEPSENDSEPALSSEASQTQSSWAEQLAQGKFQEIMTSAHVFGVERSLQSKSSAELIALAQAARYTGNTSLAERCWTRVRARFPGSPGAQKSAFFLAKVKEQRGQSGEALRWFQTYLGESPHGVYASEALGRQLAIAKRSKSSRATELAEQYLKRFPKGAYAKTARDTLARE